MSTSRPDESTAADEDDAATVAADERNDNEAARDAAATALWTRCLEHAGTSPRDQKIPTHVAVLKDIHGADYSTLLKCPLDDRSEHPYGQKGERKLAATGALARCRIERGGDDVRGGRIVADGPTQEVTRMGQKESLHTIVAAGSVRLSSDEISRGLAGLEGVFSVEAGFGAELGEDEHLMATLIRRTPFRFRHRRSAGGGGPRCEAPKNNHLPLRSASTRKDDSIPLTC